MDIRKLMSIESEFNKIQSMLDDFCDLTGLAAVITDKTGVGLTEVANISKYCSKVRKLGNECIKSDEEGLKLAYESGSINIYSCHAGVMDLAIPIQVDGELVGSILAGQVRLKNSYSLKLPEFIMNNPEKLDKYRSLYDEIPYMTREQLKKSGKVLEILSKYISERLEHLIQVEQRSTEETENSYDYRLFKLVNAIRSLNYQEGINQLETIIDLFLKGDDYFQYRDKLSKSMYKVLNELGIDIPQVSEIENLSIMDEIINSNYINTVNYFKYYHYAFNKVLEKKVFRVSNPLEYVLAYTQCNFHKKITVKDMADYSNLSVDYFSKKFKKFYGSNYIDYLNTVRIRNAKRMLYSENLTVSEVGLIVGFSDPNYFTRVFKKNEGISPTEFRNKK